MDEHVDIFLGNHTIDNKVLDKRQRIISGESQDIFIDPSEWKTYLLYKKELLHQFIAEQL